MAYAIVAIVAQVVVVIVDVEAGSDGEGAELILAEQLLAGAGQGFRVGAPRRLRDCSGDNVEGGQSGSRCGGRRTCSSSKLCVETMRGSPSVSRKRLRPWLYTGSEPALSSSRNQPRHEMFSCRAPFPRHALKRVKIVQSPSRWFVSLRTTGTCSIDPGERCKTTVMKWGVTLSVRCQ